MHSIAIHEDQSHVLLFALCHGVRYVTVQCSAVQCSIAYHSFYAIEEVSDSLHWGHQIACQGEPGEVVEEEDVEELGVVEVDVEGAAVALVSHIDIWIQVIHLTTTMHHTHCMHHLPPPMTAALFSITLCHSTPLRGPSPPKSYTHTVTDTDAVTEKASDEEWRTIHTHTQSHTHTQGTGARAHNISISIKESSMVRDVSCMTSATTCMSGSISPYNCMCV